MRMSSLSSLAEAMPALDSVLVLIARKPAMERQGLFLVIGSMLEIESTFLILQRPDDVVNFAR